MKFGKPKESDGAQAKNWYIDRYQHVSVQRNVLAFITITALVALVVVVTILAYITPLKTIEPYVIQVEERSGITQVVDPLKSGEITANEALKNYFILRYLRAREEYTPNADILQDAYSTVRLMSDPTVFSEFRAYVSSTNENSPANRYRDKTRRVIKIKTFTYLEPNRVQIRFRADEISVGMRRISNTEHLIALINFEFTNLELTLQERYINPLGFRVTAYNVAPEIVYRDE